MLFITSNVLLCFETPSQADPSRGRCRSPRWQAGPPQQPPGRVGLAAGDCPWPRCGASSRGTTLATKTCPLISFVSTLWPRRESCILINIMIVRNRLLQRASQTQLHAGITGRWSKQCLDRWGMAGGEIQRAAFPQWVRDLGLRSGLVRGLISPRPPAPTMPQGPTPAARGPPRDHRFKSPCAAWLGHPSNKKTVRTPGAESREGVPQPKLWLGGGTRGPTPGPGTRPGGSSGKR